LAFSAARTYHHLAVTLEQAGFEIRDQIMWIYSSGFPKSQDVGRQLHKKENGKPDKQRYSKDEMTKEGDNYRHNENKKLYRILPDINGDRLEKSHEGQGYGYIFEEIITIDNEWSGWGTALKPAHEPIALARKPIKLSIAKNAQKWGTGALNIDATRIPTDELKPSKMGSTAHANYNAEKNSDQGLTQGEDLDWFPNEGGRFPSNVIGEILQADYQKYFYCPKVSRRERHIGFDTTNIPTNPDGMWDDGVQFQEKKQLIAPIEHYQQGDVKNHPLWDPSIGTNVQRLKKKVQEHNEALGIKSVGNNHPTVKPIELMKYLIKLITPPGGIVLDPFNGSGSTGCAAVELGYNYIGCELDPAYVEIAKKRIEAWYKDKCPLEATGLFE
jgi:site-specific DNA-methyltransferase (adenine-specific)